MEPHISCIQGYTFIRVFFTRAIFLSPILKPSLTIFQNACMWHHVVYFTISMQTKVTILLINGVCFDVLDYNSCKLIVSSGHHGAASVTSQYFDAGTMPWRRQQPSIRENNTMFENKPNDLGPIDLSSHFRNETRKTQQVTWAWAQRNVTCQVKWLTKRARERSRVPQEFCQELRGGK